LVERLDQEHTERISQLESQLIQEGVAMTKQNYQLQVKCTAEKEEEILKAETILRITLNKEFDSRLKVFLIMNSL
jgi:glutamate-1-semialdehyde aminotransferase